MRRASSRSAARPRRPQLDGRDPRAAAGQRREVGRLRAGGGAEVEDPLARAAGSTIRATSMRGAALPHRQAAGPRPRVLERERAPRGRTPRAPASSRRPARRAARTRGRTRGPRSGFQRSADSAGCVRGLHRPHGVAPRPATPTRRSAIQSGIEWRRAPPSAPSASSAARRGRRLVGDAAQDGVDDPRPRRRPAPWTAAQRAGLARPPGRPRRGPARRRRRRSRMRPGAGCRARPAPARPGGRAAPSMSQSSVRRRWTAP